MKRCECGHPLADHCGFFADCVARRCDCRGYLERAAWVVRVWRWLKAVPR